MLSDEERKQRHREHNRRHYEKNKEAKKAKWKEFYKNNKEAVSKRRKAWYTANRDYAIQYSKQWNEKNIDKRRLAWRIKNLRRYGLTIESFDALLAIQGRICPICEKSDPGPRGWVVDHCHETNIARGILCHHCNIALGNFFDDIGRLQRATKYLQDAAAPYDAGLDFSRSIEACYAAVRERVTAGGPTWVPKQQSTAKIALKCRKPDGPP